MEQEFIAGRKAVLNIVSYQVTHRQDIMAGAAAYILRPARKFCTAGFRTTLPAGRAVACIVMAGAWCAIVSSALMYAPVIPVVAPT